MVAAPASIAVVGGGIAGFSAVRELRRHGYAGELSLVDPAGLPYDRPPLSKAFLAGTLDRLRLQLAPGQWYADNRTTVIADTVDKLDAGNGTEAPVLALASGRELAADAVLLATGARARRLPLPGMDLPGVFTLRSAGDAQALQAYLDADAHLVILGAGLIGAEVAGTARGLGAAVTLVDPAELPAASAVGVDMAGYLHHLHAVHGTKYVRGAAAAVTGAGKSLLVELADGGTLRGTAVLVAAGSEPETALAETAGLSVDGGVLVDAAGRTSHPRIFAAGDSSRRIGPDGVPGRRFEHWDAARRTGEAAAAGMLGVDPPAEAVDWFWSDRYGVHLEVAGSMAVPGRTVLRGEPGAGFTAFRLGVDGILAGVAAVDGGTAVRAARKLIESGRILDPGLLRDPGTDLRRLARGKP
ncbi:NAD(P)/FAD-dependent oxidoreductase [Arthrobacter sp. zg-Y769]|uniref:NAD(P)/FAD-dependent oxidoreductase n=1 Tax=Arthrobacter sp. zg-Y769 TaxID=2894191 RepID=UPI001E2A7767|nr:FAD-dependent oxidoreductase [Arthrobacter sp. zg-Y769]MCC9204088.1 FAD-dependent oxidoreductase [Arthrobacter sp. zg-Y769]